GKRLVHLEHGSLPNILAGKGIVPELIQGDATGEKMAKEALRMLNNKEYLASMRRELGGVREALGASGASRRAAEVVYRTV
ncbi:MAG: lipid-A-disaccharide synthase, partial [Deltaproteobacteria bacterium]